MMAAEDITAQAQQTGTASADVARLPEYDTRSLFDGAREIVIHHAGAAYRMKITKQGKLILNK
ncbi:hemin uptake protein HemP [Rhizobium sp. KVB221]|uniref:Hemin uptake protein HemP n=1 Tax=Rhizobium setariae TaxID=2801340 RepID=A0A936YI16_9HYPH|nr:hemin uptake protein HemP [Rhizobium setariae]MBL0370540.1 hemin uptake protein HemP [Rhizobium setariae]